MFKAWSRSGVFVEPGNTELTRIPRDRFSVAAVFVKPSKACFDAQYAAIDGNRRSGVMTQEEAWLLLARLLAPPLSARGRRGLPRRPADARGCGRRSPRRD